MKIINNNFKTNQIQLIFNNEKGNNEKGANQPPEKRITIILDINKILEYSAEKNKVNPIAEYSTL